MTPGRQAAATRRSPAAATAPAADSTARLAANMAWRACPSATAAARARCSAPGSSRAA